jgi:phage/conjugal plasmid C-4 type zinc finger TraR family protein
MAVGFAKDGAEQEEIQAVVQAAVRHARAQLHDSTAISLEACLDCLTPIPEGRRKVVPGVKYCIDCQTEHDTMFTRDKRNCWHRSMR